MDKRNCREKFSFIKNIFVKKEILPTQLTSFNREEIHDLVNQINIVAGSIRGLNLLLPNLLKAYEISKAQGLNIPPISEENFSLLKEILNSAQESILKISNTFNDKR